MDRNTPYWVGMAVCVCFIVGGIVWDEPAAIWIGIGLMLFANIYGEVAALLEKRKQK